MIEDWDLGECKECYIKMVGLLRNWCFLFLWFCCLCMFVVML